MDELEDMIFIYKTNENKQATKQAEISPSKDFYYQCISKQYSVFEESLPIERLGWSQSHHQGEIYKEQHRFIAEMRKG